MNFKAVIQKIKDVISKEIGERRVLNKDVASALDLTPENFSTLKNRDKLPLQEILYFCAKRKISINWLLFDQNISSLENETDKFMKIRYFRDISASAGGGAYNDDEDFEYIFVDREVFGVKNIEAINVIGDSMEPLISEGSIVFVDRDDKSISKNGIFVVTSPYGLFVKRLNLKTNGHLELISENSVYPVEEIGVEEVQVVGRVVKLVSDI